VKAVPFEALALISVPDLARADPSLMERHLLIGQAVAESLPELGLCEPEVAARFHSDPPDFVLRLGDLTEEGLAFARSGFQRWLSNTDRWTGAVTLEKLKATLRKQWEKSRGTSL
jgi:hypothetical protein